MLIVLSTLFATDWHAHAASPSSSSEAVSLLASAEAALSGSTAISDVTLTGSAGYTAGSDEETGTVTLKAKGGLESSLSLSLSSGPRIETRQNQSGQWSGSDGQAHQMSWHSRERLNTQPLASLETNLESGVGFFRSLRFEAGDLGHDLAAMMRSLAERAIPDLYPKLELGSREVDGTEAEEFLKQANLSNLSPLFHGGEKGLGLVTKAEGGKFVPNPKAEIAQEILTYLKREHAYGNKVTGAALTEYFGGLGYGWSSDIVRLVLAVLFRAGAIEVTHQARRHRNYQDPQARIPFSTNPSFRSASFSPRESIDQKNCHYLSREPCVS